MPIAQRPNVIFILTDDQGPWAAGCYGNEEIRTPNIDQLAAEGVLFQNFFCTSPVCSPARASILTGRIPSQHGVHDWIRDGNMPPDAAAYIEGFTCYTDVLRANGYTCGLSGKWHLGDSLHAQHGFSHWYCHQRGGGPYNDPPMVVDGRAVNESGYITDLITDDAIAFIDANRETPFYLSVNYTAPHSPWHGHPQDIVDSYDTCAFETCPQEPVHPWAGPLTHRSGGDRESLKGYFAAVTAMDANVGRLIGRLDTLGLRENTLVIFSSDNGFSCGHHGFWGKGNGTFPINMYENSVKVPMILSHPARLQRGLTVESLCSQYDVFPTLLEYLEIPSLDDPTLPGTSMVGLLDGHDSAQDRDVVVYDEYGPVRMVRTDEWKYVHRYQFGQHELFDMQNDPEERRNLIDEPAKQSTIAELRKRLAEWFSRFVDPSMDGARLPVSGSGQKDRIGRMESGEGCFHSDRIEIGPTGFPAVRQFGDSDELNAAIADR